MSQRKAKRQRLSEKKRPCSYEEPERCNLDDKCYWILDECLLNPYKIYHSHISDNIGGIEGLVKLTELYTSYDEFLNNRGNDYYFGQGVDRDYKKAVKFWLQAAKGDNIIAMYNLGNAYYNGEGVDQDYKKAVKFWLQAADKGESNAMFNLGICYSQGRGVKQDEKEAVKWFREAAKRGDADAMYIIGSIYNRWGLEKEAMEWWRKAADKGNTNAIEELMVRELDSDSDFMDESLDSGFDIDKFRGLDSDSDFEVI